MRMMTEVLRSWFRVPPRGNNWREIRRPAMRQTVRVLVSVAAAWGVGRALHLHETIWALVTALIVTQASITQTMSTARDQVTGTLLGALAGSIALLLELWTGLRWVPFWIVLVPLVFLASVQTNLRFACITLMIIYLFPTQGGSPFLPMVMRLTAIVTGVLISVAVSFVVLHSSARRHAFERSGRLFRKLDGLLRGTLDREMGWRETEEQYEACTRLLHEVEEAVEEARRERFTVLEERDPVLAALPKVMRRLLNDTMLVGRAIATGRAAGNTGLVTLHRSLSHALRTLARNCEFRSGKGQQDAGSQQEDDEDILAFLPHLEEQTRPEMRFVMSLFREDLERAVHVIMREEPEGAKGL